MSRARELAKAGGVQQRIAGFSSHVGMSTFLAAVHMEDNLTVDGNIGVGGNLTVTGTTTFNGGTLTLGDANTDNVVFGGDVNSNIIPNTDNAYDLGSSSQEWKDLYVDGTANIDSLVADTADINGGTVDGATVGANSASSGAFTTLTASGNVDLGDATSDTITATGRFDSDIVPSTDNARDLGASGLEFKDLYLDGTANIDSLVADTADINGGTVDGAAIGGASASTGAFTTLSASGQTDLNGDINLGDANTDSITPVGRFDAHIIPLTDNAVDLGASGVEFKDLYIDGTANIDSLVADTADINGGTADNVVIGGSTAAAGSFTTVAASSNLTVSGNGSVTGTFDVDGATTLDGLTVAEGATFSSTLGVTGTTTLSGQLDANGDVNLGNATTDSVTVTGRFDSDLLPIADGTSDLGSSTLEWQDLYIDGTANIDSLVADTADINGGTVDGATIGANSASTGAFTTISASGNVDFNGDLDVDGTTNLDVVDIDGAVDMATTLTLAGNADFNGNLDVDGQTYLDNTDIVGTLNITGFTNIDNVTVNASTVSTSSGNLTLDSTGGTVAINDAATVSGNLTVTGNTVLNGTIDLGDATSDTITATGRFDSDLVPSTDGARDLGTSTLEWKDLYLDGTANIDSLVADTADINAGTIDNTVIGGSTAVAGSFTTVAASSNVTVTGAIDIDGHTNLDNVSVAGVSTFTGATTFTGAIDANGGATVDNIQIGVSNDNEIDTSSGNLVIDSAGGTTTVDDNLTVSGNLTVNGTTTTINSTTVAIDDKNFQVATGAADDSAADGAGLTVDSGDGDKTWNFEATGDNWGASENINIASGKAYKINNTSVLNATTLGSSVVASSLTSVGTIASGVWQGTAIANGYLANSSVSYGGVSLSLGGSDGTPAFDLSDATNYPTSSLSGTITNAQLAGSIANGKLSNSSVSYGGVSLSLGGSDGTPAFDLSDATNYPTSSLSGTITNAQLAGSIANSKLSTISTANKVSISALNIDGGTDIGADIVNADEIIIDDGGGGTNRRSDMTRVKKYIWSSASGDATASDSGAITLANSGVSAATYGSSTALPVITIDAKGRITSATTTAIDSTTISNGGGSVAVGSGGGVTVTGDTTFANNVNLGDDDTITFGAGSDGTIKSDGANFLVQGSANGATYFRGSTVYIGANGGSGGYNHAIVVDESGDERVRLYYGSTTRLTTTSSGLTLTGTTTGTFSGNITGNVTGNTSGSSGSCTGNAATATALANARNIAGVSFDGTSNISLNNNAITNGAGYITSSGTSAACSGNAATATLATNSTITANNSNNETVYPVFVDGATGTQGLESDTGFSYNPNSNTLTAGTFSGALSGNATTATSATNADTVDSLHASQFVRSDTSDTMSGTLTMSGNIVPNANGTRNLGASGTRWANVYSSDLDLSNEAKGANKVDGTWGSYLIEEGEDNLYLTNRRNGKSYRFVLEEV